MDSNRISAKIHGSWIGRPLVVLDSVDSTMNYALRPDCLTHGCAVVACTQTSGRGRLDHVWTSPPGSIYMSVVVRMDDKHTSTLIQVTSLAIYDVVAKYTGKCPEIKWPNDILVSSKKISGFIINSRGQYAVIGIGLNVNVRPDIANTTSIKEIIGHDDDIESVIADLLDNIEIRYEADQNTQMNEWKKRISTIGKDLSISADGIYNGKAVALTDEGHLVVRLLNGEEKVFAAGDVHLL